MLMILINKCFENVNLLSENKSLEVGFMYKSLYPKNSTTGNRVIEISLDDYNDFFHEWDNSILKKRDMNPELTEFLDQCSEDIPLKDKMEIIFFIENDSKDPDKENELKESYNNYYSLYYRIEKKKIKELYQSTIVLVLIGLCTPRSKQK